MLDPAILTKIDEEVIEISHNTNNIASSFKGYNVYYKIYKNSDSSITTDRDYLTDTSSTRSPSESLLTSRNYRPIKLVEFQNNTFNTTEQSPDIKPDLSNLSAPYSVTIDVSTGIADYPPLRDSNNKATQIVPDADFSQGPSADEFHILFISNNNNKVLLLRRDTNPAKGFFNNQNGTKAYSSTDADFSKMVKTDFVENEALIIVFAVISFGIDFEAAQQAFGNIVMSEEITIAYTQTP